MAAEAEDDALIAHQRKLAAATRLIEVASAAVAAQIAQRSQREFGYQGLAQRHGAHTPEALVQHAIGGTLGATRRLVRVGTLVAETTPSQPWLRPVIDAAAAGILSTEAVEAIRAGLGTPSESVTVDALTEAARTLADEAIAATPLAAVTVEGCARRARQLRDGLDLAGVACREQERRDRRYLHLIPQVNGMTRLAGLLDPESAATLGAAIDAATSPRRGGPRFVDPVAVAAAETLLADSRSTEQIALDTLVELVGTALRAQPSTIGARRTDVRVIVTQHDLDRRSGAGHLDGQTSSISVDTVERLACDGGLIPILFSDKGQALNLGRSQRPHSQSQRIAIAVRDGGCLMPDCSRPPSWCEVHHIQPFGHGGVTSVEDGMPLSAKRTSV